MVLWATLCWDWSSAAHVYGPACLLCVSDMYNLVTDDVTDSVYISLLQTNNKSVLVLMHGLILPSTVPRPLIFYQFRHWTARKYRSHKLLAYRQDYHITPPPRQNKNKNKKTITYAHLSKKWISQFIYKPTGIVLNKIYCAIDLKILDRANTGTASV